MAPKFSSPILFSILLLLLIYSIPFALAQSEAYPEPPPTLVLDVYRTETYEPSNPTFQAFWHMTFQLSPQDPDQTVGSFPYALRQDGFVVSWDVPRAAVANRPGWVNVTGDLAGTDLLKTINLTTNGTSGNQSLYSCDLEVDFFDNLSHYECGTSVLAPPQGVSVITTQTTNSSGRPFQVNLSFQGSEDDLLDDFNYYLTTGRSNTSLYNDSTFSPTNYATGFWTETIEGSAPEGASVITYYQVWARDGGTLQRSALSCQVIADANILYNSAFCGNVTLPNQGGTLGDVTFPFLNVTKVADAMGATESLVGYMVGIPLLLGLGFIGYLLGQFVGGIVGFGSGLAFIAALGIMPLWIVVIIVLASVAFIVLTLRGSQ